MVTLREMFQKEFQNGETMRVHHHHHPTAQHHHRSLSRQRSRRDCQTRLDLDVLAALPGTSSCSSREEGRLETYKRAALPGTSSEASRVLPGRAGSIPFLTRSSRERSSASSGRGGGQEEASSSSGSGRSSEEEEIRLHNLLPGIPDRVTIEGILTKTSWRTLCTLAAVNRAWRHAIQSRRVYKARNYINSTKTLVVMIHKAPPPKSCATQGHFEDDEDTHHSTLTTRCGRPVPAHWRYAISLYDSAENSWHRLPFIPGVSSGIPKNCGCVFLHGKLYVVGGEDYDKVHSKREVYVMDLAACRGVWQSCASMRSGRSEFRCAAENGRIYVFGGGYQSEINYSRDAAVYDPEEDRWHAVADMIHQRTNHTVVSLEGKMFVIGGSVWLEEEDDALYQSLDCDDLFDSTLHATFAEVYDPWKNIWRKMENVTKRETDDAFVVVRGKLHVLRPDSVHVYDVSSNSWTFLQHISWEVQACIGAKDCCVCVAAFVDGELLALVGRTREEDYGLILLRSKNFLRRNCQVTWAPITAPLEFDTQFFSLCPIQL